MSSRSHCRCGVPRYNQLPLCAYCGNAYPGLADSVARSNGGLIRVAVFVFLPVAMVVVSGTVGW